jgi:hypothetical protein
MTAGQIPIAATATTVTSSANLSGDVVSTATTLATTIQANAVTTAKILNANVTYAKIQNVANNRLLGNTSGSAAAPSEIALPLAVANGGTGLASGTSGGIPYYSTTTAITSSAVLTANAIITGGGAGAAPVASAATVDGSGNVGAGTVTSSGAVAGFAFADRTTSAQWQWYATSGSTRLYNPTAGDGVTVAVGGGMIIGAPTGGNKGVGTLNAVTVYGSGTALTSDARLKRDIEALPDDCLGLVEAIEPKRFRWSVPDPLPPRMTPEGPGEPMTPEELAPLGFYERSRWGFLAQDIRAAIDVAVEEDAEGIQSYDPAALTACLWRAVQELAARVAELEARGASGG